MIILMAIKLATQALRILLKTFLRISLNISWMNPKSFRKKDEKRQSYSFIFLQGPSTNQVAQVTQNSIESLFVCSKNPDIPGLCYNPLMNPELPRVFTLNWPPADMCDPNVQHVSLCLTWWQWRLNMFWQNWSLSHAVRSKQTGQLKF